LSPSAAAGQGGAGELAAGLVLRRALEVVHGHHLLPPGGLGAGGQEGRGAAQVAADLETAPPPPPPWAASRCRQCRKSATPRRVSNSQERDTGWPTGRARGGPPRVRTAPRRRLTGVCERPRRRR